jgi:D-alanyl-D-alanine dipeptidase
MKKFLITIFLEVLIIIITGIMMTTTHAQSNVVLITDPNVIAIPIHENHEPMIDLRDHPGLVVGPSPEMAGNTDYTRLRKTVYEKVLQAQKLLPPGLHFCLYEGYRSLKLQKMIFDNRVAKLKRLHPDWSYDQAFMEATRLVSPVMHLDGSKNIPPHSTGGAFDIYLLDAQNNPVDMGIHPKDWMDDNDGSISLTASTNISAAAQKNRKIMSAVLEAEGFANYTSEYWHWSYGDRYWAHQKGLPSAIYDSYQGV